jgi:hypothetical protein
MGVWHVLGIIQTTSTLLKALTNFTLEEFDKFGAFRVYFGVRV